ncbi:Katanin p80 subunit, C-terminal [Sesbania bispinosa]|nr:Katanin p80 subunit, C-terminal [Sesbania bispinosa]
MVAIMIDEHLLVKIWMSLVLLDVALLIFEICLVPDEARGQKVNRDVCSVEVQKRGRMRSVLNLEKRERSLNYEGPRQGISHGRISSVHMLPFSGRAHSISTEKTTVSASDEDYIADVMEQHDEFLSSMQARSAKLQAVFRCWERNDVKEVIGAMEKMNDHAVIADVVSIIMEKIDIVTLDVCTGLLPLLTDLLQSEMDRHLGISLEMLLKLVRIFGSVIYSTLSAKPSVGVDIEAEKRLERCNLCFIELEKVKRSLPSLLRRGGSIAKSAQELNLFLQDVSQILEAKAYEACHPSADGCTVLSMTHLHLLILKISLRSTTNLIWCKILPLI